MVDLSKGLMLKYKKNICVCLLDWVVFTFLLVQAIRYMTLIIKSFYTVLNDV